MEDFTHTLGFEAEHMSQPLDNAPVLGLAQVFIRSQAGIWIITVTQIVYDILVTTLYFTNFISYNYDNSIG